MDSDHEVEEMGAPFPKGRFICQICDVCEDWHGTDCRICENSVLRAVRDVEAHLRIKGTIDV